MAACMVSGFRVVTKKCGQYIHVLALAGQCLHGGKACCLWLCPTPQWQDWVCKQEAARWKTWAVSSYSMPYKVLAKEEKMNWTGVLSLHFAQTQAGKWSAWGHWWLPLHCLFESQNHKGWKRLKSNCRPTSSTTNPPSSYVLKCHSHLFQTLGGRVTPPLLWAVHSCALHPFCEEFFPDIWSKLPWVQLEAISSYSVPDVWEKRPIPTWLQPAFRQL